jgi:hypothetical protein
MEPDPEVELDPGMEPKLNPKPDPDVFKCRIWIRMCMRNQMQNHIQLQNRMLNQGSLLWSVVSLIPLTTKKVDFTVEYLSKYYAIFKKALTRGPGAQIEFFDKRKHRRPKVY